MTATQTPQTLQKTKALCFVLAFVSCNFHCRKLWHCVLCLLLFTATSIASRSDMTYSSLGQQISTYLAGKKEKKSVAFTGKCLQDVGVKPNDSFMTSGPTRPGPDDVRSCYSCRRRPVWLESICCVFAASRGH